MRKRCRKLALAAAGAISFLFGHQPAEATDRNLYNQLDLLGDVIDRVRSHYVDKPDDAKLIEAAINGILLSLDPHSSFLNSRAFRDMQVGTRGEFGSIGVEVTMKGGTLEIVTPIEGAPSARAGLLSGDLITHIDGKTIRGLTLQQASNKIRGPVDTPIELTIVRNGSGGPFNIKMTREVIRIPPVRSRVEGDIGYLRISSFNEETSESLKKGVEKLKKAIGDRIAGFVIDLRNNPGGLLDQAIAVSDAFLEKGAIVITRGRSREETQRSNARPGDITDGRKLVVLINGGTASASEIVAGALQDHRRATILGTRSFGHGSVQTIIPLGSRGALRLTTSRYYTPSGRSIQAKGIEPTIVVKQKLPERLKSHKQRQGEASLRGHLKNEDETEHFGSSAYVPKDRAKDTQLQRAIALIREKGAQTPSTSDVELKYWNLVKSSKNKSDIEGYLRAYPDGRFAPLARLRIRRLERSR